MFLAAGCARERTPRDEPRPGPDTTVGSSEEPGEPVDLVAELGGVRGPSGERYEIDSSLAPDHMHGDFNGDGRRDAALSIRERASGKRGIVLIHAGETAPSDRAHVLGAGRAFGNGGDDFSWLDRWTVRPAREVPRAQPRGPDVLLVEKSEAASAYIRWNGSEYVWTQAGD